MAEDHGVAEQTIRYFRQHHRDEIEAKKANWSARFDHLWAVQAKNRLRLLELRLGINTSLNADAAGMFVAFVGISTYVLNCGGGKR
jgi:hypothetical protein